MTGDRDIGSSDPVPGGKRPSLLHSLFEFRLPMEAALFWIHGIQHPWPRVDKSERKVVMLIPGFMAGDLSLAPLSFFCQWLGHKTEYAGIWSNSDCPRETMMHLEQRLERIHQRYQQRVVVIGQSLGGVYARELAARRPQSVERVITLGSPIRDVTDSSAPLVAATARMVARARRLEGGCMTESCACGMKLAERHPGEVPTTVVYSRTDGVVHWESCVDRTGARGVENVEVMASHIGMGLNSDVYRVIADRLAIAPRTSRPKPRLKTLRRLGLQQQRA